MSKTKYLRHTLTDPYLRGLRAKTDLQITDGTIPGLQARYSCKTGRISFYLCYRVRGTDAQRNMKIGAYGDFSIREIKMRAARYRQEIFDGRDPMLEMRQQTQARLDAETKRKKTRDVFPRFYEKYCKRHLNDTSAKYHESNFRIYIAPVIGDIAITDVGLPHIQEIYDNIAAARAVATADHVLSCISVFLNWCEKYEYRTMNSNPCKYVEKGKRKKTKYMVLDTDGYKKLLAALESGAAARVYAPAAFLAIRALALTGCRCGEITDLERDELDLDNNYLRLKKRKTDAFDVPLSDAAVATIRDALAICRSRKYVFHSPRDITKPIVDLRRAFWWALDAAGLPRMRIHDLRHSFASFAASMGENLNYIKDVLGHTRISTTEIYAHTTGDGAKRTANNVADAILG